jgi:ADP-L-glycero-D-manno-heptose 6-epimerase
VDHDVPGRLLLTGGSGFIGSALLWELNRRGFDDVVVADVLDRSEKWKNLVPLRFRDYLDAYELLARVERDPAFLSGFGSVVHLGACSATTETDAAFLMRNNYGYTKTLAEAALARDVRFVYASSAATYGALERDLSESRPLPSLRPLNMYAYSKHLFDLYAERTGMLGRIAGLKYFNVYGPNEAHKGDMRSVVAKAYDQIEKGGVVQLFRSHRAEFADGEQRRDFLYVKDAVRMTLALATNPQATGLFNIGSGTPHTWLELARAVFAALDREPRIEFVDMPESLRDKYQYHTEATTERLRSAGFDERVTSLNQGVADYVRRYLAVDSHLDPAVPEPRRNVSDASLRLAAQSATRSA